jgi:hypothetical protein
MWNLKGSNSWEQRIERGFQGLGEGTRRDWGRGQGFNVSVMQNEQVQKV